MADDGSGTEQSGDDRTGDDHPGAALSSHRAAFEQAEREISRAAAVLTRLETRADRAGRGVDDPDHATAVEAFDRWVAGADAAGIPGDRAWRLPDDDRQTALSYLTDPLLDGDTVFGQTLDPADADVQSLAADLKTYVEGGNAEPADLTADFQTLVESGDGPTLAALGTLFEWIVRAARRHRDECRRAINGEAVDPGGTAAAQTNPNADGEGTPGAGGALSDFFTDLPDELSILDDEPIALLPVRLETRFVTPNDETPDGSLEGDGGITAATDPVLEGTGVLGDWNRTEPAQQELRVRVYPDQVHVDSHEPELTADEERWGRNFWAQVWFACHRTETVDGETKISYDESKLPADLEDVVATLHDGWGERFSTDDADRHAEIKERAWGQLVDRFGQERGAWIVHAMAPEEGTALLTGWAGSESPWPTDQGAPDLDFPDPETRPESWSRQPKARLLPDRWLAVGTWRRADEPDAEPETVRVTGDPIQQPLPVGPNPESVGGEAIEEREGTAPEGMEWMVDWEAARDVGMALTVTPDDLDGEDPGEVVFEELLVVGVKASLSGTESTDGLESLLAAHHYSDGLELLRRGTPTNNHDLDSGYVKNPRPEETVGVEAGAPLTTFGDFSDGDLLSRALGISDPGEPHVFAHVDGAGERSQAAARHMNSALWPGTIGYYLQNVLVSNDWTGLGSLWNGDSTGGFPDSPMEALGAKLKSLDAWRRHFVRYVRAGGPFPPIRVGRQPYGVLPVEALWSGGDESESPVTTVPEDLDLDIGTTVNTPTGQVDLSEPVGRDLTKTPGDLDFSGKPTTGSPEPTDPSADGTDSTPESTDSPPESTDPTPESTAPSERIDTTDETGGSVGDDVVKLDAETAGQVSTSGYSVAVPETATQTDADLYGSSFDPATPLSLSGSSPTLKQPDGGAPATMLRHRPFRVDDRLPTELGNWLRTVTPGWENAVEHVDRVDDSSTDAGQVERILQREASVDAYVREGLVGADASGGSHVLTEHQSDLRKTLTDYGLDSLDPRLAWLVPSFEHVGTHDPSRIRPIATIASDRAPHYLSILYEYDLEFLREMGFPTPLSKFTVDREVFKDVVGYGDGIDDLSDEQIALDVILRSPDHGWLKGMRLLALTSIGDDVPAVTDSSTVTGRKVDALVETDGDALQHTLFKQLTRFSTIEAYLNARIRLGVMWDEPLLSDVEQLLSADGPTQQPVPDPSRVDDDTNTVWDALADNPSPYYEYDTYAELLRKTCAPGYDEPAVDPRMREFFESLAALEAQDAADLRRLTTETLDLASHRLDAWWTSLATRRLFEHRERQEVDLYDGADYAFVGDQFWRGEGTETPSSAVDTVTGTGVQVDYDQLSIAEDGDSDGKRGSDQQSEPGQPKTVDAEPQYQVKGTQDIQTAGTESGPLLGGQTEYGFLENAQSRAVRTQGMGIGLQGQATTAESEQADAGEPVTYVGAYAFVENLHSDDLDAALPGTDSATGGEEAEYVHAPSPQHATTAAILRSGRKNHDDDDALAELLDIDLSPGRVRAAKHVLEGVRQGQLLGELLGYRFERRLRERTKAYNDRNADTINLVKYKFALREAYPAVEGQLDHGQGETAGDSSGGSQSETGDGEGGEGGDGEDGEAGSTGIGSEAAKSDVVDGYRLLTNWQGTDDSSFLAGVEYEAAGEDADGDDVPSNLDEALSGAARTEFLTVFRELDAIVDSVTDLLLSESVHQLGKGNFERAGGTVDDLVKGKQVAEPEVAQTPRKDVGVTHRLGVVFGDPGTASTPTEWNYRSSVVEPDSLPRVGATEPLRDHTVNAPLHLQPRADAERNLDDWLGTLLPNPKRVTCGASIRWTDDRATATGTATLPTSEGSVSVTDLDFAPDLVVLSVPHAVGEGEVAGDAGPHGWTHAVALQNPDGSVDHVSTSVGLDPAGTEGSGLVSDGDLHLRLHDAGGDHGEISGSVAFADDGFTLDLDAVDLPENALEGSAVTYRAYALGNAATVEVGHFETPTGSGSHSVPLSVDADHVMLFGNTAATTANSTRSTGDAVGLSHGVATESNGTVEQHVVASSVDPATGDAVGGIHDDEALHLPFGSGGAVAGATAASVQRLGTSLDLSYSSVHAGSAGDASRVVAYVAIETPDRVDSPAVGVIDGTRGAGDQTTVTTGFEPGYVEFVTAPSVSSTGSDASLTTAGFAHGTAVGVGRQVASTHVTRADGDGVVHAGETSRGQALSIPSVATDGTVSGHDAARVASVSDDGFTVSFTEVASGDQVIGYRAWPADPDEVTHVVDDGVSLHELELAPLDALALSQANQQAGASQLEQRMHYQVLRNPPEHEPPVPDDATVELTFAEAGPGAPDDSVPVGAFLETVRELQQLVADGRPMDAGDLGHPSEVDDAGYTEASARELQERADDAQDRLAAAGALVENRVELLDTEEDETRITQDVAVLRERLTAFRREVPIDGLSAVAGRVGSTLSADQDALMDELDDLAAHLPAGPVDRESVEAAVTVTNRAGQQVAGRVQAADADVTVEVWSTSGVEWFERTPATTTTGPEGAFSVPMDFDDVTPGTGFMVYVREGTTLLAALPGRVLPPEGAVTARPEQAQTVELETELGQGTTLDVSVTPAGADSPLVDDEPVDVGAGGYLRVEADFSSLSPWTVFDVEATQDGDTVASAEGYVEPDAVGVVSDTDVLGPLLWLADRRNAFDPHGGDGEVPALHRAVTEEIDWAAVRDECELMADLHDKTGGGADAMPAERDVEAVASVVDVDLTALAGTEWDQDADALEKLDLPALDAAVATVGRALSGLAVDDLFDVTGRPDRAEGLRFWANNDAMTDEGVLTRFHGFRRHPSGVYDDDLPNVGFAPSLEAAFTDTADAYPRGETDAQRFLHYLRPFLRAMPRLVQDAAFQAQLADPAGLARHLHAVAFHPEEAPTGNDRSTFLADLRRLTRQPVLDGALFTPYAPSMAMASGMDDVLAASGVEPPFYNHDERLLDLDSDDGGSGDGESGDDGSDGQPGDTPPGGGAGGPGGGSGGWLGSGLPGGPGSGPGSGPGGFGGSFGNANFPDPEDLDVQHLRSNFDLVVGPEDTPSGTPVTDFRYLLEVFRTDVLTTYLAALDRGDLPPDETTSRGDYAADLTSKATTLETTVSTQYGHLSAGFDAGDFDVAFRRGVLETLRRGMLRVSYFGVYGSTPQSVRGGEEADVETLLGQARGVVATVKERMGQADEPATESPTPSVDGQRRRLEAVFGEDFPVLPTFRPMNAAELTATFGRSTELQGGDPLAAETWLQRTTRVRDESARFRRALTYAESLTARRHRSLQVGQLPHRESELWVGLDGEDPEPGRLSLVAQFGAGFDGSFDGGPIAGLFVDEHVENVPSPTETTGVALNYDDPDVTAPQSILLALPPEDGGWSRDALEDVVRDTRKLMGLRMVDLQDLGDAGEFGSLLPMLTFPNNDAPAPDAPSMDVDRIRYFDDLAPNPATIENFWEDDS